MNKKGKWQKSGPGEIIIIQKRNKREGKKGFDKM